MPVVREYASAVVRPGSVVRASGAEAAARTFGELASVASGLAGQAARAMAATAEQEAVALAERAVFDIDENGVPQLPPEERRRMGTIARRAYDRTIEQRFRQRLATSFEERLNAARDRNPFDLEGFQAEAAVIADGFAASVPEDHAGFFADEAHKISAQIGSRIGWAEGQLAIRNAGADFAKASLTTPDEINMLVMAGDDAGALARISELEEYGRSLPPGAVNVYEIEGAVADAKHAYAYGQLMRRVVREEWTPQQMADAEEALRTGSDETLNGLFPTAASRRQAASQLSVLRSLQAGEASAEAQAAEDRQQIALIVSGAAPGTKKEQQLFDAHLAGGGPPLTPEAWTSGQLRDAQTWATITKAGFLPYSLEGAFLQFARGALDIDRAENVYRMWSQLAGGRAPDGSPSDVGGKVPEAAAQTLELTRHYVESGGLGFSDAYDRARSLIGEGFDQETLFQRLAEFGPRSEAGLFGPVSGVLPEGSTLESMNTHLRRYMRDRLHEDIGVMPSADLNRATLLFKTLVVGGATEAEAYDQVKGHMELRNAETEMIYSPSTGRVARSWAAPEKVYAHPDDPGFFGRNLSGRKSWFETWFEGEILPDLADATGVAPEELRLGDNVVLEPVDADRTSPAYRVWVDLDDNPGPERSVLIADPFNAYERERERLRAEEREEIERARLFDQEQRALRGNPATIPFNMGLGLR